MRVLIVGAGVVGSNLAEELSNSGHDVSVIDSDSDLVRRLKDRMDVLTIEGNGAQPSVLRRAGIEVPDTRAWRLEALRAEHPIVDALLTWRRAERIRTTFGFPWLDGNVGADGRLRGRWSGSDGAAGRMTAARNVTLSFAFHDV